VFLFSFTPPLFHTRADFGLLLPPKPDRTCDVVREHKSPIFSTFFPQTRGNYLFTPPPPFLFSTIVEVGVRLGIVSMVLRPRFPTALFSFETRGLDLAPPAF